MPVSAFVLQSAAQAAEQLLEDPSPAALVKGVEHLPTFTQPARQRWESIPADIRQRLLSNVWCGHCSHETTITNFSGTLPAGVLSNPGSHFFERQPSATIHKGSDSLQALFLAIPAPRGVPTTCAARDHRSKRPELAIFSSTGTAFRYIVENSFWKTKRNIQSTFSRYRY